MQTRWPTHPTIFLTVRFYAGSQVPITNANILRINLENISWKFDNRRTGFGKIFFWQWVLKQLLSIPWYTLDVLKYEWNQLAFVETRNVKFNRRFPKLVLSNVWFLTDCFVQGSSKNTAAPSMCDIQEIYFKLRISATNVRWLVSFSVIRPSVLDIQFTNVGICSNRSNLHIS